MDDGLPPDPRFLGNSSVVKDGIRMLDKWVWTRGTCCSILAIGGPSAVDAFPAHLQEIGRYVSQRHLFDAYSSTP